MNRIQNFSWYNRVVVLQVETPDTTTLFLLGLNLPEEDRMKFKNKIIISFCIILFVPILLAVLVLFGFQKIQIKAIEQTYGIAGIDYNYL